MEDFIREHSTLVGKILANQGINESILRDLEQLNNLNDNIATKEFHSMKNKNNFIFSFSFAKPIKSPEEFEKYLIKNKIENYKVKDKEEYDYVDYSLIFNSGVRADFYNRG